MRELKSVIGYRRLYLRNSISWLVLLGIFGCTLGVKSLSAKTDGSVEQAKERGAFLWEYDVLAFVKPDTMTLEIEEVFAEHQFRYLGYKDSAPTIDRTSSQVVMIFKQNRFEIGWSESWDIPGAKARGPYNDVKFYDKSMPPDTLTLIIEKPERMINDSVEVAKEIGRIVLARKR